MDLLRNHQNNNNSDLLSLNLESAACRLTNNQPDSQQIIIQSKPARNNMRDTGGRNQFDMQSMGVLDNRMDSHRSFNSLQQFKDN